MKRTVSVALLLALVGLTTACTDNATAARALRNLGMTDIQTEGYSLFGCGEGDSFHTRFSAKNPNGQPVAGVVCSGWLKGSTVRFD